MPCTTEGFSVRAIALENHIPSRHDSELVSSASEVEEIVLIVIRVVVLTFQLTYFQIEQVHQNVEKGIFQIT